MLTASFLTSRLTLRKRSLGQLVVSSTMMLLATIGTLIVVLALLILFHHNVNATKGYRLRSLEHARGELLLQKEVLGMEIAKAQALETVQTDQKVKMMVRAVKPKYAPGEPTIASAIGE